MQSLRSHHDRESYRRYFGVEWPAGAELHDLWPGYTGIRRALPELNSKPRNSTGSRIRSFVSRRRSVASEAICTDGATPRSRKTPALAR